MVDRHRSVAVFDLDETLIRCKSMFSFLEFAFSTTETGKQSHLAALAALKVARKNQSREEVNRQFWRLFAGWHLNRLDTLAEDWFASLVQTNPFYPEVLARFRLHQAEGHQTVLLSGSADFIIAPIARLLAPDAVLAIHLIAMPNGTTNGEIEGVQTIGQGKAVALERFLAEGPRGRSVYGYGDHASDLPFLRLCDPAYCVLPTTEPLPGWALGLNRMDIES
jgi:HAD superfamily hydrolase (TIGR01490 family)